MLLEEITSETSTNLDSSIILLIIVIFFALGYHFHKYLMVREAYEKNYAKIRNEYLRECEKKMNGKK